MWHFYLWQFQVSHTQLYLIQPRWHRNEIGINMFLLIQYKNTIQPQINVLITCGDSSGGDPSRLPSVYQKSLLSLPIFSVKISALFFLSFLFIFSAMSRAFDFNVFLALFPYQMKIFIPVSKTNTYLGSSDSVLTATGSKWIDGPAACTR